MRTESSKNYLLYRRVIICGILICVIASGLTIIRIDKFIDEKPVPGSDERVKVFERNVPYIVLPGFEPSRRYYRLMVGDGKKHETSFVISYSSTEITAIDKVKFTPETKEILIFLSDGSAVALKHKHGVKAVWARR